MNRFCKFMLQAILAAIASFLIFSSWIGTFIMEGDIAEKLHQCETAPKSFKGRMLDPCADLRKRLQQIEQLTNTTSFKRRPWIAIFFACAATDRALRAWRLRRACRSVLKATEFLRNLSQTERFCIVFRPFGSDGVVALPLQG